jgi:hypothetical protein
MISAVLLTLFGSLTGLALFFHQNKTRSRAEILSWMASALVLIGGIVWYHEQGVTSSQYTETTSGCGSPIIHGQQNSRNDIQVSCK